MISPNGCLSPLNRRPVKGNIAKMNKLPDWAFFTIAIIAGFVLMRIFFG